MAASTATATPTVTETATGTPTTGPAVADYPEQECVAVKQGAAATYCEATLAAWASFDTSGDATARDAAIAAARTGLESAWTDAEETALAEGVDCSDLALGAGRYLYQASPCGAGSSTAISSPTLMVSPAIISA